MEAGVAARRADSTARKPLPAGGGGGGCSAAASGPLGADLGEYPPTPLLLPGDTWSIGGGRLLEVGSSSSGACPAPAPAPAPARDLPPLGVAVPLGRERAMMRMNRLLW